MLFKKPLNLGNQIFRINRGMPFIGPFGKKGYTMRPGWWESAACRKVQCDHYLQGWVTSIDESDVAGVRRAYWIRHDAQREYREDRDMEGVTRFRFAPGQMCFRDHPRAVERDPIFANVALGQEDRVVDYDEFFTTFNEIVEQRRQNKREV